jgi:hypothetical protein
MNLKKALQQVSVDSTESIVQASYEKWKHGPQSPEVYNELTNIWQNYRGLMGAPQVLEKLLQDDNISTSGIEAVTWGARLMIVSLVNMAEAAELPTID